MGRLQPHGRCLAGMPAVMARTDQVSGPADQFDRSTVDRVGERDDRRARVRGGPERFPGQDRQAGTGGPDPASAMWTRRRPVSTYRCPTPGTSGIGRLARAVARPAAGWCAGGWSSARLPLVLVVIRQGAAAPRKVPCRGGVLVQCPVGPGEQGEPGEQAQYRQVGESY